MSATLVILASQENCLEVAEVMAARSVSRPRSRPSLTVQRTSQGFRVSGSRSKLNLLVEDLSSSKVGPKVMLLWSL